MRTEYIWIRTGIRNVWRKVHRTIKPSSIKYNLLKAIFEWANPGLFQYLFLYLRCIGCVINKLVVSTEFKLGSSEWKVRTVTTEQTTLLENNHSYDVINTIPCSLPCNLHSQTLHTCVSRLLCSLCLIKAVF